MKTNLSDDDRRIYHVEPISSINEVRETFEWVYPWLNDVNCPLTPNLPKRNIELIKVYSGDEQAVLNQVKNRGYEMVDPAYLLGLGVYYRAAHKKHKYVVSLSPKNLFTGENGFSGFLCLDWHDERELRLLSKDRYIGPSWWVAVYSKRRKPLNVLEQFQYSEQRVIEEMEAIIELKKDTLAKQVLIAYLVKGNSPNMIFVRKFVRPKKEIFPEFFENLKNVKVVIDKEIDAAIDFCRINAMDHFFMDEERQYEQWRTQVENTNDESIVRELNVTQVSSFQEIIVTAAYLIEEDLNNRGPLYELSLTGQENLNLGYYFSHRVGGSEMDNSMKVVWIERLKPEGKNREYHLHCLNAPRDYKKKDRNFLVRQK